MALRAYVRFGWAAYCAWLALRYASAPEVASPSVYFVTVVAAEAGPTGVVTAWGFAADIETDRVRDMAWEELDGRMINMPTRAVTGRLWDATEMD